VGSKLVSSKILDGNGVKAMPGSIPAPNTGSFENKKIQVAKWGTPKKKLVSKQLSTKDYLLFVLSNQTENVTVFKSDI